MIFNLASAALIYKEYKQNNNGTYDIFTTYPEFCLSVTELFFIILFIFFNIFIIITNPDYRPKQKQILPFISIVEAFNIAFSSFVIEFYNEERQFTQNIINIALAIIILNSLALCGLIL
jgi:hypothetical protein